ncbi:HlyD family type I secretion periplasmic adaptor subunit [Sphingomonas arenae]|uniref:HlyD family type I secretion periplasmic adaptor subunit n=1 Tax=Sphingomonas arenae TaxID=2812555 RepID=UPI00196825D7
MTAVQVLDFAAPPEVASATIDDPRRDVRIGSAIAFLFFVVLLGWAAFVPLDAGVHAQGVVAVSGHRQSVQHREGGVVTAIHVREGQKVEAGQLLVEMSAPDLLAAERALTSDYLTLLAQRARLLAERAGQSTFAPPPEFASISPDDRPLATQALELQRAQLRAKQASLQAQQSVLGQRSSQLREQQVGYAEQRASLREQQRILNDEVKGLRELEQKGFAATNRIRAGERMLEELRGREAAMAAEMARASEGMGETRMQSLSLSSGKLEEVAAELRDTQSKLSEVLPKLISAREQLQRARVRSPATGTVVGLTVFTVGGVVSPGQTLMEVVPANKMLVIQAQVDPRGADDVYQGQKAQVRFTSVDDRTLPLLSGRVRTISADSFTDEKTGRSYFRAEVEVSPQELNKVRDVLGRGQLRPGLPVELVMAVRKRTALQYLFEPISHHLWSAMREQ